MIQYLIYAMVYTGSALMVYNIYCFIQFARFIKRRKVWMKSAVILNIPILLLIFFLIGYLVIGIFGKPDLMMAGVLFGGSIFVQIMYRLLNSIVRQVIESEHLKAKLEAAEESSRAKTSFLANISHEMRTPMNVILGMDEVALKNPALEKETRDQLEKIGHSARYLSGLINNILDIQDAEGDRKSAHTGYVSLEAALTQIESVISASCGEKGLTWQAAIEEGAVRSYTGDASRLERALMNILDNAVKFTDAPGTVRFSVHGISSGEDLTGMEFIISDSGVGIDETFLSEIFEPFSREDNSFTNRFGGSGLGLTAAKEIITNMGGEIKVQSVKNEGSTFTVKLPMVTGSLQEECPDAFEEGEGDAGDDFEMRLEGRRILVVDDIEENAEIVADLLELEGAESDHALNGQIALEMFEKSDINGYDAILMDLRMPVMDGLEAARRIRAMNRPDAKSVPIIALSANAYESDVQNSLDAGMNSHLAKPADSELLCGEVSRWIRKTEERGSHRHDQSEED